MAPRSIIDVFACLGLTLSALGQGGGSATSPLAPAPDADLDGSGQLDAIDCLRFSTLFSAGDPRADIDGSGSLDPFDGLAFLNAFIAGPAVDGPGWADDRAPGSWCLTQEMYTAALIEQGLDPIALACAPDGPCDNPADRNAAIPTEATPVKTYRLSIHVFCDNNGSNCAATPSDVAAAVARLNADYAPWRVQFVYQVNFINNTKVHAFDPGDEWNMKRTYSIAPAMWLNVYVVNTGGGNWGTFPWDPDALGQQGGIVLHETGFRANTTFPSIFTHEVGHCLGLWHTHHGVSEVPECSDCYEQAGRSPEDGDVAGDRCSDTNPTPRNDGRCYDAPGNDPCSGNPWGSTPYLNFMSYSYGTCPIEFTPQQAGRVHCWAADKLSGWQEVPAPPAAPGSPSLSKIGGGVVRASWADNSVNEDGFRVQRETKSGANWINTQIVATVGPNTMSATNSPGAGTFRYRVQAFNAIGDSTWSGWTQIKN